MKETITRPKYNVALIGIFIHFIMLTPTSSKAQWTTVSSFNSKCTALEFINRDTGFVAMINTQNGILLKTYDGALTWDTSYQFPPGEAIVDLHFTNKDTGFALSQSTKLFKTTDGGSNWTVKYSDVNGPEGQAVVDAYKKM